MNAEVIAEWCCRQGYQVIRTESTYWCNEGLRVFQAFPWHWMITPSQHEVSQFLLQHGAVGVRYSTPVSAPLGSISYHTVYQNGTYDLHDLSHRARNGIRKGLQNVVIEQIPFERLAEEGWGLLAETLKRQNRSHEEDYDRWCRRCKASSDLPGFEAWGAIARGRLVAALLAVTCDDCYTMLNHQSATDYLPFHANNALTYIVTHNAINRPGITKVFYGVQSLCASDEVDAFKMRMGYTAVPVRQRIQFHPGLVPILNRHTHRFTKYLVGRYPNHTRLSKIEGCLRFYQNGKLPLNQQVCPRLLKSDLETATLSQAA